MASPTSTGLPGDVRPGPLQAEALLRLHGAPEAREMLQAALDHLDGLLTTVASPPPTPPETDTGTHFTPLATPLLPSHASSQLVGTVVSAFADDEDLSREQLQIIKARTMYNMVEEIDDGQTKLLFLTNPQAEQIASTPESIQKLLDALEIPMPSLVIELLGSWGSRFSTESESPEWFAQAATSHAAGVLHGNPPFLSREDERAAAAKIDMFMADVLIPLAAQTNAVVLCGATGNDLLSTRRHSRGCTASPSTGGAGRRPSRSSHPTMLLATSIAIGESRDTLPRYLLPEGGEGTASPGTRGSFA